MSEDKETQTTPMEEVESDTGAGVGSIEIPKIQLSKEERQLLNPESFSEFLADEPEDAIPAKAIRPPPPAASAQRNPSYSAPTRDPVTVQLGNTRGTRNIAFAESPPRPSSPVLSEVGSSGYTGKKRGRKSNAERLAAMEQMSKPQDAAGVLAEERLKAVIRRKIVSYINEFPSRLGGIRRPPAPSDSLKMHQSILADVEEELNAGSALPALVMILQGLVGLAEAGSQNAPWLGLNLDGLTDDLSQRLPHMSDELRELSIKYADTFSVSVEKRLMLKFAEMAMDRHRKNSGSLPPMEPTRPTTEAAMGVAADYSDI